MSSEHQYDSHHALLHNMQSHSTKSHSLKSVKSVGKWWRTHVSQLCFSQPQKDFEFPLQTAWPMFTDIKANKLVTKQVRGKLLWQLSCQAQSPPLPLHSFCCCCFCHKLKKRSGSHPIFQGPHPIIQVPAYLLQFFGEAAVLQAEADFGDKQWFDPWSRSHVPWLTLISLSWQEQRR